MAAASKPRAGGTGAGQAAKSPKRKAAESEARSVIESAPPAKTITLRDVEFQLPDALPPSMIFDLVEVEAAEGTGNPIPIFRLVRGILGPDQFNRLRNSLDSASEQDIGETMAEAVEAIFGVYGVTPGEA